MILPFQHLPTLTADAEMQLSAVGSRFIWEKIKSDILDGYSKLYALPDHTYIVLRIDGGELVIVAITGKNGCDAMETCMAIAKANKLDRIRFHTKRRGLARMLKRFNPVQGETIYRVQVT